MVLNQAIGRLSATVDGRFATITLAPCRSVFLTAALLVWGMLLLACCVFTLLTLVRSSVSWRWLIAPMLFLGSMLAYAATLLRWNTKGKETIAISPAGVCRVRTFHPGRNGTQSFRNDPGTFSIWRPNIMSHAQVGFDWEIWGMGPWSLSLLEASTRRVALIARLTKSDARRAGEALRSAGYVVENLDALK